MGEMKIHTNVCCLTSILVLHIFSSKSAGLIQLVECLFCKQEVRGSSPLSSTTYDYFKMIDLQTLKKYLSKSKQTVEEVITPPKKEMIDGLFSKLFKNFTGNGLQKRGSSIKIDENGIVSNLSSGNYLMTDVSSSVFTQGNFEIQVKFFKTKLTPLNNSYYTWDWVGSSNDPPLFCAFGTNTSSSKLNCHTFYYFNQRYYVIGSVSLPNNSEEEVVNKWLYYNFKYNNGVSECRIMDENYKLLAENIFELGIKPQNITSKVAIGNYSNYVGQPTAIKYDLSESYIKVNDEIVSSWNK